MQSCISPSQSENRDQYTQQKHARFVHTVSRATVRNTPAAGSSGYFCRHHHGVWAARGRWRSNVTAKANSEPSVQQHVNQVKKRQCHCPCLLKYGKSNGLLSIMELIKQPKVGQWSTHGQMPAQGLTVSPRYSSWEMSFLKLQCHKRSQRTTSAASIKKSEQIHGHLQRRFY